VGQGSPAACRRGTPILCGVGVRRRCSSLAGAFGRRGFPCGGSPLRVIGDLGSLSTQSRQQRSKIFSSARVAGVGVMKYPECGAPASAAKTHPHAAPHRLGHAGPPRPRRPGAAGRSAPRARPCRSSRPVRVQGRDCGSKAPRGRPGNQARRTFPPFGHETSPGIGARRDRGSTAAHCAVFDPRSPMDTLWGYSRAGWRFRQQTRRGALLSTPWLHSRIPVTERYRPSRDRLASRSK